MSEAVKKSDIQQGQIFDDLAKEIKKASKQLRKYDESLKSIAKTYREDLSKTEKASIQNLQKINNLEKQATKNVKAKQSNTKKLSAVEKEQLRLEKAISKERAQSNTKIKEQSKILKDLKDKKKAEAKATRESTKAAERQKNAYTALSDKSRDYKNESKRLGAELLKLEQSGKKNTKEYRRLSKSYEDLTLKARATDAQLKQLDKSVGDNFRSVGDYENQVKKAVSALRKESTEINRNLKALRQQQKNVKKGSAEFNQYSKIINKTENRQREINQELNITNNNLKRTTKTTNIYNKSIGGLSRALGSLGIIVGVGAAFRSFGNIIADNDQALTDLAAISGKTADELEPLNKQARQLGATTQFSATEVTGLQIELAKLGFTTQEIMDSTGGIANFAAATGVEIPRAAKLAGSSLRAFGLEANEIDRVVSTLGVATTKSALDFAQLETSLSKVAPVAASFGFSVEDTTALLGQLANAGFDASTAATSTRNILLNLADANGDLAKKLGRPVKSADDLAGALQELDSKGVDLAESLELTDKRSVAAFQTFLKGAGDVTELRDSITDVNGELTEMADKRLDSVTGAMKLLSSAFQEQVLGFNEATGASEGFKNSIKFLAENLGTILGVLARVGAMFLIYRMRAKIAAASNFLFNGGLKNMLSAIPKAIAGLRGMSLSFKGVGRAMKSIPFIAIIAGLVELISFLWDATDAADANREAEEKLNDELERGNEIRAERVNSQDEINELVEKRNKLSQAQLKSLRDEIKREIELAEAADKNLKLARDRIKEAQSTQDINEIKINQLREQLNLTRGNTIAEQQEREAIQFKIDLLIAENTEAEEKQKLAKEGLKLEDDELKNINKRKEQLALILPLIKEDTKERKGRPEIIKKETDALSKQNDELLKQRDYLREALDLFQKIRDEDDLLDIDTDAIEDSMIGDAPILPEEKIEETIDAQDELLETFYQVQKNITRVVEDNVDKRIAALNKELKAQQDLRSNLQALANEGNIEAQQSIKSTIEAEREKEAEIARLEKRKQDIMLISQGLQTFTNLLDQGEDPGSAFSQTVITSQALVSFLAGLDGFATGTDNAPEGWAVTQEKGSEIIADKAGNIKSLGEDGGAKLTYLQKGDQVKTAQESANILRSFDNMNNMRTIPKNDTAGTSYDLLAVTELRGIKQAIKSQPYSQTDWENISKGLGAVRSTTFKGGDKTISKHYVKK